MNGLEDKINALLAAETPVGWTATSCGKELYADLSEPIVRQAVAWQNKEGRIIDPFVHEETPTVTARFVGALGFLIRAGRCLDLIDACARSMTIACKDLHDADKKTVPGAEFYVKELMAGYVAMRHHVDSKIVGEWEAHLGGYDPEKNYDAVLSKKKAEDLHNFCTFALAGEEFKRKCGIADNADFIEKYLETQIPWFTESGMYRDPHDPMTYDGVSRMNLSLMLHWGYRGKHFAFVDEMLRKGGLTQLLYMSSTGECPFGGRSNQQNFNEAMISILCEYEAIRCKKLGNARLAGAFKRMAKLSALSVRRWLEMAPPRFNKNSFPIESQHGRQKGYGFYGAYSLLIASQFGFAHLLADDTIGESPAPCEIGGYVLRLREAFHKIFASCQGYHIEIDTNADFCYDASGLGRVHRIGIPTELGLSCPISSNPSYLVSRGASPRNISIGPGWLDESGATRWLADFSNEQDAAELAIEEENANVVRFTLKYKNLKDCDAVIEEYKIGKDGVWVTNHIENRTETVLAQFPLLLSDGRDNAAIEVADKAFVVKYKGARHMVECLYPEEVETCLEPFEASNRNGVYKIGCFKASARSITYKITLSTFGTP